MIVMKFGGTSTEDAAAMRNVVRIVKTHLKSQPVVVISAIARATNELEHIARTASLGEESQAIELVDSLIRRHLTIVSELISNAKRRENLEAAISAYKAELVTKVASLAKQRVMNAAAADGICSFGERLSSRIVAAALEEDGSSSEWIDVREFMLTDDKFGRARPLMAQAQEKIRAVMNPLIAAGKIPVTQGFIGMSPSGEYTTMGRESSDYSATVIGALLPAKKVQIWTDVDGILTADPRVIGPVRKVRRMSFDEALQLSLSGAKVLHPTTMVPVREREIPVQILNSKKEQGTGTLIEVASFPARGCVKSIAHKRNMVLVAFSPLGPGSSTAFTSRVVPLLSARGIIPLIATTSGENAVMLLDKHVVDRDVLDEIGMFGRARVHSDKSSVTLVGSGVGENIELIGRISALCSEGNISMMSGPVTDSSFTLVIDTEHLSAALSKLHRVFIEEVQDSEMFDTISA